MFEFRSAAIRSYPEVSEPKQSKNVVGFQFGFEVIRQPDFRTFQELIKR